MYDAIHMAVASIHVGHCPDIVVKTEPVRGEGFIKVIDKSKSHSHVLKNHITAVNKINNLDGEKFSQTLRLSVAVNF